MCTHGTAAAMAELELRRLQSCSTHVARFWIKQYDRALGHINDIGIMEEPARRWHEQNAERQISIPDRSKYCGADSVSQHQGRSCGPGTCTRGMPHRASRQRPMLRYFSNATLLLPDGVVSELGEFAAWFAGYRWRSRRCSRQGHAEVGMSCQLANIDGEGLQSNLFRGRGRLVCSVIPSLAILHALVEMLHQPVRMLSSSQ